MKKYYIFIFIILFFLNDNQAQIPDSLAHYSLIQLDSICDYYGKGRRYEALSFYSKIALDKAKLENAPKDTTYANILYHRGYALDYNEEDHEQAMDFYIQAKELYLILENREGGYIDVLNNMGLLYTNLNEFKAAEDIFLKLIAVEKDATTYNNLAFIYSKQGRYEEAEHLCEKALELIDTSSIDYSTSRYNLAFIYTYMQRYEEAEAVFLELLEIGERKYGRKSFEYADFLYGLGTAYEGKNEYQKARDSYEKVMKIDEELGGKNNVDYVASLSKVAAMYEKEKNYIKTEKLLLEALSISEKTFGDKSVEYAFVLIDLGDLYVLENKTEKAIEKYLEAININKNIWGERTLNNIDNLEAVALSYISIDQEKAWKYIKKALQDNTKDTIDFGTNDNWIYELGNREYYFWEDIINELSVLDKLLELESKKEEQKIIADIALQFSLKKQNQYTSNENKIKSLKKTKKWIDRYLLLLDKDKDKDKIFELIEWNKSILLSNAISTDRAYSFGDLPDSLAQKEKILYQEKEELNAALLQDYAKEEKEEIRSDLNSINIELNRFKKEIEKNYPKYTALKYQQKNIDVEEVQKELDEQAAMLQYLITDSLVYIYYIDKNSTKIINLKIDNNELKRKIKQFHETLSNYNLLVKDRKAAYQNYTKNAHWFYQKLIDPLAIDNKINQLIIIPDGELAHLPFESFLMTEAVNKELDYWELDYMLKVYKISYNYSASLWQENKNKTKNIAIKNQILAIASDYSLEVDASRLDYRLPAHVRLRTVLNPLPDAQKEVEKLAEQFDGHFAFGKNATEAQFKVKAKDYGVIHLAMHGILDNKNPVLSSLAFTEDGDSLENNLLQAYEISKMELNANLVVLSACETGYGKFETGNGVASLARSFMYAGVPSLVVSLWQVNDMATSIIMQNFYTELAAGMDKAAALQKAKLDYLQKAKGQAAHPAFWSAFVQIGATEAIQLDKKGIAWYWWALGGMFVLVGIFLVKMRLK